MSFNRLLVLGMTLALLAAACGGWGVADADADADAGSAEGGSSGLGFADVDADAGPSGTVPLVKSTKPSVPSGTSSGDLMTTSEVMEDLAARRGVPLDAVVLVSEQQVTWPSGALGCPQAGMSYTQALVPGGRIVLKVNDMNFFYHSGRTGAFFYCENPLSGSLEHPDA